jgi:hypothetical protein
MVVRKAYSNLESSRHTSATLTGYFTFFAILIFLIPCGRISAQKVPEYDEISVFLDVPRVGGGDISAVIKGQELYLPVTDLFDFLKIRNVPSPGLESISGFFINPEATYTISRTENQIRYQDKTFNLEPGDIVRTESNLYLKSSWFGKVFGLDCKFNFRSLSVKVESKLELPLIREMRQEEMRKNITRLKGEVNADTVIDRSYPLFKFGMADWSAMASEVPNGHSETTLNLALGSMIAGGEANASLYYNSNNPFTEKQQFYLWRYVNNDFAPMRQAMVGKIATNAISSIYSPVIGVQFTNTPTTYRRSFGTYTLSDKTEPGWIVELYVNNVLVDYVKADASGFFTFQVPLVYGNSIVNLRFFGPWGEERSREQNINIPFNFLPEKTMEYTLSAGIVEDSLRSRYSRLNINYGLTRSLTVGGGVEYFSSVVSNPAMPYLDASLRITNNLLISGEYTFRVRARGTLSYVLPSNMQLDLNYTWYDRNQKAINYNYWEERKATLSIPLRIAKFSTYQRFSVYQIVLPASHYTTAEWLFSSSLAGISTNLTTYGLFIDKSNPYLYSNLSLAVRLPGGFVFMPQVQYGYSHSEFISAKLSIEKHLMEYAFLNLSYEQIFRTNIKLTEVGFRYDFSFAQTGASVRQSDKTTTLVQYARGSLINDRKTKYLGVDNRTNVGKGGISVVSYLDLNANGRRDHGEAKVYGLNLRANGGRVEKSERDSTIRILGLEPYTTCFIELDPNSFGNVSWRLPKQTISVVVDPNILKLIEIPIEVVGEATGKVTLENKGEKKGLGRIIVNFYKANQNSAGRTLTEDDGYFSYFGMAPGKYFARIDTGQLKKLGMISEPETIKFDIKAGIDGDIAEGLDFNLKMKPADTTGIKSPVQEKPTVRKDTAYLVVHEVTQELVTILEDSYAIQLGAFLKRSSAEAYRKKLENILGKKIEIIIEDNFFKLRISEIKDRKVVDDYISVLHQNGINEVWVISLKAKKQQLVLTEKQDTISKITESLIGKPELYGSKGITVQLGAFRDKSNALALLKSLTERYGNRVFMVFNDGFYKLRLSGMPLVKQSVLDELNKLGPKLGKFKFKDIWMQPIIKQSEEIPVAAGRTEIILNKIVVNLEIPLLARTETNLSLKTTTLVKPATQQALTISIKVGSFIKKSDALRAQRRITSKLGLNVEIVQQYEYYIVLIRGFHSREETYKYYPELAGLGYPGVSIVEE